MESSGSANTTVKKANGGLAAKLMRLSSPLHQAASQGQHQVVEELLVGGYDVHATDSAKSTPLQRAAAEGHLEIVTQLLRHGADVNRQDLIHGNSPLHEASWRGYSQTVNLICKAGANPDVVNRAGFTPLHLACQNGHNQTTRYLLLAGASPDKQNSYGDTALHTAARYGHAGVTRILLSGKANINVQNKNGDSVLHIATAMGRRRLTRILLESGSDCLLKNKQNETALVIAVRKDYKELLNLLQHPPPLRTREERWKEKRRKMESRSRSKNSEERSKDRTDSGNSSRDSGSSHRKKRQKSVARGSEKPSVAWSPYGCHATPDLAEALSPKLDTIPNDLLRDGEQYYLDLAGNIRKGPVGITTACYCGPLLHRLECHLAKSKQEIVGHVDLTHEKLTHKIDSLERNTRRQLAGLQRTVDSLGLESSSLGLQQAADKLDLRRHPVRKQALDKKYRAHRSQHDLSRNNNEELTIYKIPPSNGENHYLEMYPARTKREDVYITRADMQSTLDRLGLERGRYEWNEELRIDTNQNVAAMTDRLTKINFKDESGVIERDQNRLTTEAIVHTENFRTSSSKMYDSRLSLSLSTETSSQSTFISQKSRTKEHQKYDLENQRASSDSGIGLLPQNSQDLRYSLLVNNPPPTDHEREVLKIIDQYQDYSSDDSCESGLEDVVEDEPLNTSQVTLPPPMSLSLTNAKKYTSHHNMHLHEIGNDRRYTRYGPDSKCGAPDLRFLSPISEEKSRLSDTYSTKGSPIFNQTISTHDEDKHDDSGYGTRIGMSSEGTSPALSGATFSTDNDVPHEPIRPPYIDQSVGLPNPEQWNAHRRQLISGKHQFKPHRSDMMPLTEISESSLV